MGHEAPVCRAGNRHQPDVSYEASCLQKAGVRDSYTARLLKSRAERNEFELLLFSPCDLLLCPFQGDYEKM